MDLTLVYTNRESMVKKLNHLQDLSNDDPYREALFDVLEEIAGMLCEVRGLPPIVTQWAMDRD